MLTPDPPTDVYAELRDAWRRLLGNEPTRANLLVLLSHWAFETAFGRACHRYNLGNIKHRDGDGRDYVMFRCSEVVGGRQIWYDPPHPATWFRAYASLGDGVLDYLVLLRGQFGYAWPAVEAGDPADFSHRLKTRGYYTADEAVYTAGMERCLIQLDRQLGPDTAPDVQDAARAGIEQAANEPLDDEGEDDPPDAS